ncbi:MAG: hypothetical protein KDI79_23205 [Anaerolineae bacterium]|nr:hypothetical protein [Anaerolineae bacterium]
MKRLKRLRQTIQGHSRLDEAGFDFRSYGHAFEQARLLVRVFYLFIIYVLASKSAVLWDQVQVIPYADPLWPVFWIRFFEPHTAIGTLIVVSLVIGVVGFLFPNKRLARILVFVAYLSLAALSNSFGKIFHLDHMPLAVSFIFILLPTAQTTTGRLSITYKHSYLMVFWAAQLTLGLFYTLSGFWKISVGINQLLAGQINTFHPYALATLIAMRELQTQEHTILGWLIVNQPVIGWPMHLGAVYMEFFAIIAVCRPKLHQVWGIAFMAFHLGTWLFMEILFINNIFLLGLLLVLSPFAPKKIKITTFIKQLPLLGGILRIQSSLSLNQGPIKANRPQGLP